MTPKRIYKVYEVDSIDAITNEQIADGNFYVTPDGQIYIATVKADQLGFITAIITAAAAIIPGLLGGGGGNSGVAKGLAGITAFGNQLIAALQQLIQQAASGMPRQEVYAKADQLVALLSDPTAVYQAQRGNDAAALNRFKQEAGQLAQQAKATADAVSAAQTNTGKSGGTNTTPGTVTSGNSSSLDTTTLLMLGGGALILVLLIR